MSLVSPDSQIYRLSVFYCILIWTNALQHTLFDWFFFFAFFLSLEAAEVSESLKSSTASEKGPTGLCVS